MKKNSRKTQIIIASCVLGLVLALIIAFFFIKISVPDVSGKSISEASKIIKNQTFIIEIDREYSDTIPKDIILGQKPSPGTKLRMGSVITLKVSKGVEMIKVPNVEKITIAKAETALTKSKFKVKVTEIFSDDYEKGIIISQQIAAGKKMPKGSEVEIIVSKGPDLVQVPDIIGKSLEDATRAFSDAGLIIESDIQCSNLVQEGYVISQNAKAGDMIKRNSKVVVYVSAGVANTVGNTPSNNSQWGRVAEQGNWVYYCNDNYNYYLYKMRKDGSEKQILTKCVALGINVVGEWIYYTNGDSQGDGGLYKIRIDGKYKTKINSEINYFVHVENGWIYTSNPFGERKIYRMKLDGTGKTLICNDRCTDIHIVGNWIYYKNINDNLVYKICIDGSQKQVLHNDFTADSITVNGNAIFATDTYGYLKMSTDGSGFLSYKENNIQKSFINACDGWIYFLEHNFTTDGRASSAFYKMRYDTGTKTKILDINFKNTANYFINVAGDWLYFPNEDDGGYLYRIRTNGTDLQKMYN